MNEFEMLCELNCMTVYKNTIQHMTLAEIKGFLTEFGENTDVKLDVPTLMKVAKLMGH